MRSTQALAAHALNVGQNALDFVVSVFLMIDVLFFLLRDGAALARRTARRPGCPTRSCCCRPPAASRRSGSTAWSSARWSQRCFIAERNTMGEAHRAWRVNAEPSE
jgi:hypothetical protein